MSGNDFSYECEDGELFSMEDYSMDMMYRSMDVARPTQVVFHTPQAHKSISGPIVQQLDQPKQSFVFVPSSSCPPAPRCLPVSKFTVAGELTCLVQKITDHLQNQEDFDVCFVENEFMWRGKYLSGSSCFEVAINLYYDASTKLFTIAVRKMKNDCAPNGNFCVFYTALRNAISGGCSAPRIPLSKSHGALPYACGASSSGAGLTKEEFIEGIQPIFSMAHSPCQENRVQSAKMLCDVSTKQAHFLELPVFKNECVYALAGMIRDECEEVRQYAVVAVAAFAELPLYQEAFIASCVVPALFGLVENSPEPATGFETAQVRRQAALVLALLSKTHPYSVRACMDHQGCDVSHWMARAATLHDTRTREAALAVKSALEDVSVENRVIDNNGFSDDFNGLECGFA